jgi:hypothetical protein
MIGLYVSSLVDLTTEKNLCKDIVAWIVMAGGAVTFFEGWDSSTGSSLEIPRQGKSQR